MNPVYNNRGFKSLVKQPHWSNSKTILEVKKLTAVKFEDSEAVVLTSAPLTTISSEIFAISIILGYAAYCQ